MKLRASVIILLWLVSACTTPAAGPAGAAAGQPPEPPRCDLTVLVVDRPVTAAHWPPTPQVALSYAHLVDHERLRASIEDLMARGGGSAGQIVIEDAPLEVQTEATEKPPELATAAQFQAPGLVDARSGVLPVGAIIRSLPDWRHMRLIFVVGEGFPFGGPYQTAADGFVLRLINQVEAYEYDVERMSGKLAPAGETSIPERPSAPLLPAALIGAVAGLAAGWLLGGPLSGAVR